MEDEVAIWKSEANSMTSAMLGRAMNNLLTARPKKLEDAIVRLGVAPANSSLVSLGDSLWFLSRYVRDAAERAEALDDVLIPMIENTLRPRESKNVNQAFLLLNWLFQDELLFKALAKDLVTVVQRKEDHYIALGWCNLIRGLVEYELMSKQVPLNGLRERHHAFLKILCPSIPHLSRIACNQSISKDGFELPTRLAVAAADCMLVITEGLTKNPSAIPIERNRAHGASGSQRQIRVLEETHDQKKNRAHEDSNSTEGIQLWKNLDKLIILVEKLQCWSRKSRPLHAEGSDGVLKWLKMITCHHSVHQDEAGSVVPKAEVLLLSSCWKHYSILLRLEDHQFPHRFNELIGQYLSGIEFYSEDGTQGDEESIKETRKFFVNCLALLLGRLDNKRLASSMADYGTRMSNVLLSQLHCADADVITGVICIFKLAILKRTSNHLEELGEILPSLLNLLDRHDSAAKAAIVLLAHYCSITNKQCFREVLEHCSSGSMPQRRNAIEFISELIRISTCSTDLASDTTKEDMASRLLYFLRDDETVIRNQAIKVLPFIEASPQLAQSIGVYISIPRLWFEQDYIDPPLVLPAVIDLIYSSNDTIRSAASNAFVAVLKRHCQSFEVISLMLDILSSVRQGPQGHEHLKTSEEKLKDASTKDIDRVYSLIPEWSGTVQNWNSLIEPLLEKMFSDPSNATTVRFLSSISDYLADAPDLVLGRLLLQAKEQSIDESALCSGGSTSHKDDNSNLQHMLFNRLCPLLIIKLLPLRIFNNLTSSVMYGQFLHQGSGGHNYYDISDYQCIAAYMLNRAFSRFEFEDVRKLSAELCGRIHPRVLYPIVFSQLEGATELKDTLMIKTCLFTVCTSLAVRGRDAISHPTLIKIRRVLQTILLWSSVDGDEVAKAQHGCIDCLALMICAEMQDFEALKRPAVDKCHIGGKNNTSKQLDPTMHVRNAEVQQHGDTSSCLAFVISSLTDEKPEACYPSGVSESRSSVTMMLPLSYRLCMANALISACQKMSDSSKKSFAQRTLPRLIQSFKNIKDSEIRAACGQVLFSAAYHLKLAVLPYTAHLLNTCLELLREGSEREKMAGGKLLASLLGSEEPIVECISGRVYEVRSVLLVVTKSDASAELKQMCYKLLACLTA